MNPPPSQRANNFQTGVRAGPMKQWILSYRTPRRHRPFGHRLIQCVSEGLGGGGGAGVASADWHWHPAARRGGGGSDALAGEGSQRQPQKRLRLAVGGGCQSGWGRLLSVTNAIEAGACRQGDSDWAWAGRPGGGGGGTPPFQERRGGGGVSRALVAGISVGLATAKADRRLAGDCTGATRRRAAKWKEGPGRLHHTEESLGPGHTERVQCRSVPERQPLHGTKEDSCTQPKGAAPRTPPTVC